MIKTQACFEIKNNDRTYRFYCDNDSPLGETFDALKQMQSYVIDRIQDTNKSPEKEKPECI